MVEMRSMEMGRKARWATVVGLYPLLSRKTILLSTGYGFDGLGYPASDLIDAYKRHSPPELLARQPHRQDVDHFLAQFDLDTLGLVRSVEMTQAHQGSIHFHSCWSQLRASCRNEVNLAKKTSKL